MFSIIPTSLQLLLASLLWNQHTLQPPNLLRFQLRHEHAFTNTSLNVFRDVPTSSLTAAHTYTASTQKLNVPRRSSFANITSARWRADAASGWDEIEMNAPDTSKRDTLLELAKMTNNAYYEPGDAGWYDLGPDWNSTFPVGWEPDADGFRGHVFVSEDQSIVVLSIKGTCAAWPVGCGGPTVAKDKLNDNLLFSCCCARVDRTWTPVCGCYSGKGRCDQQCVEDSLVDDSLFYTIATNLYNNITYMYPDASIWLTGHSMGGSVASLLGATFGAPVVAFSAPGEKLAATRLHLPTPPSTNHITHVIHTADSVAMGVCGSPCTLGGYALETKCHLGRVILYDTVTKLGWSTGIRNHPVSVVVEKLLAEDWDVENAIEVPVPEEEQDCVDCYQWDFGNFARTSLPEMRD